MPPMVSSTHCFCKGPRLCAQGPHDGWQVSVTPVTKDPRPSSDFHGHCIHGVHLHAYRTDTHIKLQYVSLVVKRLLQESIIHADYLPS